jgi:hypothetical protein
MHRKKSKENFAIVLSGVGRVSKGRDAGGDLPNVQFKPY